MRSPCCRFFYKSKWTDLQISTQKNGTSARKWYYSMMTSDICYSRKNIRNMWVRWLQSICSICLQIGVDHSEYQSAFLTFLKRSAALCVREKLAHWRFPSLAHCAQSTKRILLARTLLPLASRNQKQISELVSSITSRATVLSYVFQVVPGNFN